MKILCAILGTDNCHISRARDIVPVLSKFGDTKADNFNINSRLQWRFAPMSDAYLVYTGNYQVEGMFGQKNRTVVLKMNYWLSL